MLSPVKPYELLIIVIAGTIAAMDTILWGFIALMALFGAVYVYQGMHREGEKARRLVREWRAEEEEHEG